MTAQEITRSQKNKYLNHMVVHMYQWKFSVFNFKISIKGVIHFLRGRGGLKTHLLRGWRSLLGVWRVKKLHSLNYHLKKGKIKDKLNDRVQFGGPFLKFQIGFQNFICVFFRRVATATFWSLGLSHFLLGILNQIT